MTDLSASTDPHLRKMLRLRPGSWVILLAMFSVFGVVTWRAAVVIKAAKSDVRGDGRTVASYGFDLSTCLVSRAQIVASGMPKDGLRVLDEPPTVIGGEVHAINEARRGKFLVSGDRVVGVSIAGRTVAYPIRMLNWHEIVNDRFGAVPVAITYSPLCDSVVVFDRRVGDTVREFGVSGLLYNSNLLMYDRQSDDAAESLWSQLQFRAVAGPAAQSGHRLTVLSCAVVRWADWLSRHPETEVLADDSGLRKRYKSDPYGHYYSLGRLKFPVEPLPREEGPELMTPTVAVWLGDDWRVKALPSIARRAGPSGVWNTELAGSSLRFTYRESPPTVLVETVTGFETTVPELGVVYSFWFAWYACHPYATIE
jgi:hypothetical protein